jgi:hypothetical protein
MGKGGAMKSIALRVALALAALLLLPAGCLRAQAEHVEITHPVYAFLDRMQILGATAGYSRAMLPLERGQVTGLLRALSAHRLELQASDREVLDRYADEFVAEADGTQQRVMLFGDPLAATVDATLAGREHSLYAWNSDDRGTTLYATLLGSVEYRAQWHEGDARDAMIGRIGGRFRGTIDGILGYELKATNGTTKGDRDLALQDPSLSGNFTYTRLHSVFFDETQAYISGSWAWGSLSLGHEAMRTGNGMGSQAVIGAMSQPFTSLRFNLHIGDVRFTFVQGWLQADGVTLATGKNFYPQKYLAMHRVEADLFGLLRAGVFESVIYSHRDLDPSYLIPFNFFKSAEHAGVDRDNPALGFDLQTLRFLPGTELHGTWLIDDVDFSRLNSTWWGNKFVWQAGAVNQSLLPRTQLAVEFTRIEPYTYTHVFSDNQYTNNGASLGLSIPPNSDDWLIETRHWLSARLTATAFFRYWRHGRNEYDATGAIVKNNGGDINEPFVWGRDSETAPFLAGPREYHRVYGAGLAYELLRDVRLGASYRYSRDSEPDTGSTGTHTLQVSLRLEY